MENSELNWPQRGKLWLRLGIRLLIILAVLLGAAKLAPPLVGLFMPFLIAFVVAWLLNPPVKYLQKRFGLNRNAISLVFLLVGLGLVGGLIGGILYSLVSQMVSFFQNWQSLWNDALAGINALAGTLEEFIKPLPEDVYNVLSDLLTRGIRWLGNVVPGLLSSAGGHMGSFALSLPSVGVAFIIFLMAAYFMLADYPVMRQKVTACIPAEFRSFFSDLKHIVVDAFGGYLKAQLILSVAVFGILLVGFFVMKENYALLLAFVFAIMDFIPIIGSGTFMVPWAVIDVVTGNYSHAIGLMITWGIVALFRRVAEPKIVGNQTGLSPIVSLIAIYVGMKVGGVLGMILGPILCLIVLNLGRGGLFDGLGRDLRAAVNDIGGILGGSVRDGAEPKE